MNYKISIVIPTRNRPEYIKHVIESCKKVKNCQIIICDNSDKKLHKLNFGPHIEYYYSSEIRSVAENFNFGISKVKGEYITFLGDDDLIGPKFNYVINKMDMLKIDSLSINMKNSVSHFFWDGVQSKFFGDIGGKGYFSDFTGDFLPLDKQKALKESVYRMGEGPVNLQRIYLGVVSVKLLNKVIDKYGEVFGGISPDIYSSILLTIESENPYSINYPFIIPGASPKSTSAMRANRTDKGDLLSFEHITRIKYLNWKDQIPKFYSHNNVWAVSLLNALELTNLNANYISYLNLYFLNIKNNLAYFELTIKALKLNKHKSIIILLFPFFFIIKIFKYAILSFRYIKHFKPGGAKYVVIKNNSIKNFISKIEKTLN